jgi:hypothetical protein
MQFAAAKRAPMKTAVPSAFQERFLIHDASESTYGQSQIAR